jgi:adenylate kinase family enzyme
VKPLRLHILGPSGSGTTTLARALAPRLGLSVLDSDDYYWMPDELPFSRKRNVEQRIELLGRDAKADGRWIVSGSMLGWGDFLMPILDMAIYLWKDSETRRLRLSARETERFGERVAPGGPQRKAFDYFLDWAVSYDSGGMGMRSRMSEEEWMSRLACPVLRLEGEMSVDEEVERTLARLAELGLV